MTGNTNSCLAALNDAFDRIYVLTLDRTTERHRHIEAELRGVNYVFFKGVDKLDLDYDELIAEGIYDEEKHHRLQRTYRSLSLGEVACALSHCRIYEDAMRRGYERILVLEDDVAMLGKNLAAFKAALTELPGNWEFLLLGYYCERYPGPRTERKRRFYQACQYLRLFNWHRVSRHYIDELPMRDFSDRLWCMGKTAGGHAYALTRAACRKFVEFHTPVFLPADRVFYYYSAGHDLNAYALKEQLFVPSELAKESVIGYASGSEKALRMTRRLTRHLGA